MTACIAKHRDERGPHEARCGFLCQPAYQRAEQQLAELGALSQWLHANLATGSSAAPNPMRVSSSESLPSPLKEEIHDHIAQIRETLRSWTQLVAEERDLVGPDNTRVEVTSTFLLAHLPWSAEQLWVDDFCEEVADLHRLAHALVPSEPRVYRMPAPCPDCAALELTRADGDDYVQCGSCGRLWTEADYHRLCVLLVDEQRRLAPLPEWASPEQVGRRLGMNPRTIRSWADRGLIECQRSPLLVRCEDVERLNEEREEASA